MRRVLFWIGGILLGLVSLVIVGFIFMLFLWPLDRSPRLEHTVWINGAGDPRIRGETWVTPGSWESTVDNKYFEVASDGSETFIGNGPQALDIARARLYQHKGQAELVVLGSVYRRDRTGSWSEFRAEDGSFIYRHYVSRRSSRGVGSAWYASASGVSCYIADLNHIAHWLVSDCNFPASVSLVFRRASYDDPWVLDEAATFARSPPPQRAPFPEAVQGTLTVIRVEPIAADADLSKGSRLETALEVAGMQHVQRVEFELVGTEPTDVSIVADNHKRNWRVRGGWVDSQGWPVLFWADHHWAHGGYTDRLGLPWGEAWLVDYSQQHQKDVSYLVYLELRQQ